MRFPILSVFDDEAVGAYMEFPMRILFDPDVRLDQTKFPRARLLSPLLEVSVVAPTTVFPIHPVLVLSD